MAIRGELTSPNTSPLSTSPQSSPQGEGDVGPSPLRRRDGDEVKQYFDGLNTGELRSFAKSMRQDPTGGEKLMWHLLRGRRFMNLKFRRQHQIGTYIVDFYCNELKLAVEVDGPTHYTEEGKAKDRIRDEYLKSQGVTVFHCDHDRLLVNTEKVLEELSYLTLTLSSRRGGLDLTPGPSPQRRGESLPHLGPLLKERESAEELYTQIQAEREKLIKQGAIKKPKPLPPITQEDIPFQIPPHWKWVRLGDVVSFIDGDRGKNYPTKREFQDTGYCLFLNTKNVLNGEFNFSINQFISEEKDNILRNGKLKRGDIILTTRGTIGNSTVKTPNL